MMRDCLKNRAGYDRVLMAVAATFLTVSATSAFAQGDQVRNSAAELAIDAAIPRPEPANVPPPTASDFKPDTIAPAPDTAKVTETAPETKPADVAAAPGPEPAKADPGKSEAKSDTNKSDTATVTQPPAATAAAPAAEPAQEPVKAASNVPVADQPVADKLRDTLGTKSLRYFEHKAERAAVEKFYTAREFAPLWTQGGVVTASGKGVIARLKDAASDGLNPSDYPVPDFAAATTPDALAEAELKLTASMLDYARQAQSGRMHWSQVGGDIQYPEHPTDPAEVLANVTTAKDASAALDSYNPPQKLYRELKKKLAELRGQGDGPAIQIAEGPALKFTPASGKRAAVEVEDERVPQLRAKLGITENVDDTHYDAKVAGAVRKFQAGAELKPTGVLDDRTV
jgi:murein L,D-transpeptidase YcbB/YkuD